MSDTHYGTDARLLELDLERRTPAHLGHHSGRVPPPPTRHRVAARLRRFADRLDG